MEPQYFHVQTAEVTPLPIFIKQHGQHQLELDLKNAQRNDTMVINPTYLAQRTRSCKTSTRPFTSSEKSCRLMIRSNELARCAAEGNPCLPAMAKISQSRELPLDSVKADLRPPIRLLKSSKCILSICPCLSYERKYDKSLKDTDMSTSCR